METTWGETQWSGMAAYRRRVYRRAAELREAKQRRAKAEAFGMDGDKVREAMARLMGEAPTVTLHMRDGSDVRVAWPGGSAAFREMLAGWLDAGLHTLTHDGQRVRLRDVVEVAS
jgi:hypothetical protein